MRVTKMKPMARFFPVRTFGKPRYHRKTRWGPPVISWFITPLTTSLHPQLTLSYLHQLGQQNPIQSNFIQFNPIKSQQIPLNPTNPHWIILNPIEFWSSLSYRLGAAPTISHVEVIWINRAVLIEDQRLVGASGHASWVNLWVSTLISCYQWKTWCKMY